MIGRSMKKQGIRVDVSAAEEMSGMDEFLSVCEMAELSKRQMRILLLRLVCGCTLKEVGVIVGLSPSRVRQISCGAYRKMWKPVYDEWSRVCGEDCESPWEEMVLLLGRG